MPGQISDIDIRLLKVFSTVVQSGGFAPACAVLNVGESTISSHMADLEARLGFRLCDRGRSGFRLTIAGKQAYEEVVALLAEIERFRMRVVALRVGLAGTLKLAISDALINHPEFKLSAAIEQLYAGDPDVHISLIVCSPREAEQAVLSESVDLAISPRHQRVPGINYTMLYEETNLLYCGNHHPIFTVRTPAEEDALLRNARFISRGYLPNFDHDLLSQPKHGATVYEIEAAELLIESGQFLGFLPDHRAAAAVREGRIRAIQPSRLRIRSEHAILTKTDRTLDRVAAAFLAKLQEIYKISPT